MVFKNLISVVEANLDTIAKTWLAEIKKSEYMSTYQKFSEDEVLKRGKAVYKNLIKWLETGASNKEVENYFEKVGAERNREGFPLTEVNYALYLTKKVFWSFSVWKVEITGLMDSSEAIELMTVLNNYFDLGNFYIERGYLNELFNKLDETKKFTKDELEKYFVKGALFRDSTKKINERMYLSELSIGVIR